MSNFMRQIRTISLHLLLFPLVVIIAEGEPLRNIPPEEVSQGHEIGSFSYTSVAALTCPEAEKISPCKCSSWDDTPDMDCSEVESEDQLKEIFSHRFLHNSFRKLDILSNKYINTLKDGDLGTSTFQSINLLEGVLTEIGDTALINSHNTLTDLGLSCNYLKSVPNISPYTKLDSLFVWSSNLTKFPHLDSKTLTELYLGANNINVIPVNAIKDLPMINTLKLASMPVTEILPGTFANSDHLSKLDLNSNNLTTLPEGAVKLHGEYSSLILKGNLITNISYEAVSSARNLDLRLNMLTEFPETVFKPLLKKGVRVHIGKNPLKCGCDIAWLVFSPTLQYALADRDDEEWKPRCSDGEAVVDLDPELYKKMCPNVTIALV